MIKGVKVVWLVLSHGRRISHGSADFGWISWWLCWGSMFFTDIILDCCPQGGHYLQSKNTVVFYNVASLPLHWEICNLALFWWCDLWIKRGENGLMDQWLFSRLKRYVRSNSLTSTEATKNRSILDRLILWTHEICLDIIFTGSTPPLVSSVISHCFWVLSE